MSPRLRPELQAAVDRVTDAATSVTTPGFTQTVWLLPASLFDALIARSGLNGRSMRAHRIERGTREAVVAMPGEAYAALERALAAISPTHAAP